MFHVTKSKKSVKLPSWLNDYFFIESKRHLKFSKFDILSIMFAVCSAVSVQFIGRYSREA